MGDLPLHELTGEVRAERAERAGSTQPDLAASLGSLPQGKGWWIEEGPQRRACGC